MGEFHIAIFNTFSPPRNLHTHYITIRHPQKSPLLWTTSHTSCTMKGTAVRSVFFLSPFTAFFVKSFVLSITELGCLCYKGHKNELSLGETHSQKINCLSFTFIKFLSDRVVKAARSVYSIMIERSPGLIRDRKYHLKSYRCLHQRFDAFHHENVIVFAKYLQINVFDFSRRQCCSGKDLVDWLMKQNECLQSRSQAVGMWQVLVDEGVLAHGKN